MATKVKEPPIAKDKRRSFAGHPPYKDTSSQIRTTSKHASPAKRNNSTSPSGRQIPNYLKPTVSSRPESSTHHAKKHLPADTQKSSTSRRNSLDKALPPCQIPKGRTASPNTRETKIRSSPSRVSKGVASTKQPISSRIPKERKTLLNCREKEIHHDVKKQESSNNAGGLGPTKEPIVGVVETHETAPIKPIEDIYSSFVTDQVKEDPINNDDDDENMKSETNGREVVLVEEVTTMNSESLIIPEQEEESKDLIPRTPEDKLEDNDGVVEENVIDITTVKQEALAKEALDERVERQDEEKMKESGTAKDDDDDDHKEDATVLKTQVVIHGKKDSVVSNDVIEETANRLREQKKNKVRALAGAFETVISFQEP